MKTKSLGTIAVLLSSLSIVACSPSQKDPPFAGVMNRQDIDVSTVKLDAADPLAMMGVDQAWKRSSGKMPDGSRVIVAVVGTGIDYTIPDLRESLWVNANEIGNAAADNLDNDDNGYPDDVFGFDFFSGDSLPYDWYGHDTFTASVIAATGRANSKVRGAAPNASIMIARYLGPDGRGNGFDADSALTYAIQNNAKVIYFNWPQGGFRPTRDGDPTPLIVEDIKIAGKKNILVVVPAGNSSNQEVPAFLQQISKLDNVLIVGGTTADGRISKRSNFGKKFVSAAAPVEGAKGFFPGGVVSSELTTTSVAAAYAAGAAALYAAMPGLGSAAKIKEAMLKGTMPGRGGEPLDVLSEGIISVSSLKP